MKRAFSAVVGLVCMMAGVAHAQQGLGAARPPGPPAGPGASRAVTPAPAPAPPAPAAIAPAAAAPAAPDRSCVLLTQAGDQFIDTPLAGFDPAVTSTPLPPVTITGAVMVVCNRATIIPEVTDYRVLTELRLPLSIKAGQKTLFLGVSGGKLQVGMPDGQATPEDTKAVQDRLDEMELAMAKPAATKPSAKK
jgi:hypothetical protein